MSKKKKDETPVQFDTTDHRFGDEESIGLSDRTFGIELEGLYPIRNHYGLAVRDRFDSRLRPDENSVHLTQWMVGTDGTVGAKDGYLQAEFRNVTLLSGYRGLAHVVNVFNTLLDSGFQPTETCGVHVHVGTSDFDDRDFDLLRKNVLHVQPFLYRLNGSMSDRRTKSYYCKPGIGEPGEARFHALNLAHIRQGPRGNRVEFRLWSPVGQDITLVMYVMVSLLLVQISRDGIDLTERHPSITFKGFTNLIKRYMTQKRYDWKCPDPEWSLTELWPLIRVQLKRSFEAQI